MRHLDLFSGIGGFALAAAWAGFTTIGFSETDEYCSKVLRRHWPRVPNFGDVRSVPSMHNISFNNGRIPVSNHFPPLANVKAETMTDIYGQSFLRIIRTIKPTWVVGGKR